MTIQCYKRPTQLAEGFRAWQQMGGGFAGLVEGSYAGTQTGYGSGVVIGTDVPASKMSGAGYSILNFSQSAGSNTEVGYSAVADIRLNMILFANKQGSAFPNQAVLRPEEAWNMDTKIDDGLPASGKLRAGPGNATACPTSTTAVSAAYNLSTTSVACMVAYLF